MQYETWRLQQGDLFLPSIHPTHILPTHMLLPLSPLWDVYTHMLLVRKYVHFLLTTCYKILPINIPSAPQLHLHATYKPVHPIKRCVRHPAIKGTCSSRYMYGNIFNSFLLLILLHSRVCGSHHCLGTDCTRLTG